MDAKFEVGKSYPIDTLPDDLLNEAVPPSEKWAIREALFWNDCQGWSLERISKVCRAIRYGESSSRFWSPLPPNPMTRAEICAERGWQICPNCDIAIINPKETHTCRGQTYE